MEELGDSGIVGGLAEELGHRDIIVFEELRHGSIQVPWDVHLGLVQVGGYHFVEELSDRNVIGLQILCHSNVVCLLAQRQFRWPIEIFPHVIFFCVEEFAA
jgi:hypothetical protein